MYLRRDPPSRVCTKGLWRGMRLGGNFCKISNRLNMQITRLSHVLKFEQVLTGFTNSISLPTTEFISAANLSVRERMNVILSYIPQFWKIRVGFHSVVNLSFFFGGNSHFFPFYLPMVILLLNE